ncbi:hypothetical protein [Nocardioides convexus]|uniref:hypothetical protein n=1 Tax=Nocardioides convexus TaxID=2712224 RepID=UPI002418BC1F|nr:hypothetical protein [Nocardioides convexus]
MTLATPTAPTYDDPRVVVPAPAAGAGNWAGAASAVLVDGTYWLTYRVRRPLTEGRGVSVVVARSEDGEHFEQVAEVHRDAFGCESFERPVLVPVPGVGWRLYLSCATPGSKHWWVDSLTAATPAEPARRGPAGGAPRRRHRRGQGPGRDPRAGGLGDAAVLPPAHRRRSRGPDDLAPAAQRGRPRLDRPRRGARRPAGGVGRPRGPRHRGAARSRGRPPHHPVRRPCGRRLELVRDHRHRHLGR